MLNRPNTFDHYFDKKDYPEYSVFIPNLIPCCSECNSLEGQSVFLNNGKRRFIHFYFDHVPEYQFVFMRLSNDESRIPKIEVFLKFQKDDPLQYLVTEHFRSLNLINKYKLSLNDKLTTIINEVKHCFSNGASLCDVEESLKIRYISMVEHYGNNYWETCIYEGVLNSNGYIQSIATPYTPSACGF
jgi:hypothetical protein